jgi:hypothetical protein
VTDAHDMPCTPPDLADPVVGFRQWRLADGRLRSLYSTVQWPGRELRAICVLGDRDYHASPANACSCGIYAYYDPCPRMASAGTRDLVAGAVVLWGRIELHAAGMRAQYARVVALELPVSRRRKRLELAQIGQRLNVPVVPHRKLAAVALEYGLRLDPAMRPPRCWEVSGSGRRGILTSAAASLAAVAGRQARVLTRGGLSD